MPVGRFGFLIVSGHLFRLRPAYGGRAVVSCRGGLRGRYFVSRQWSVVSRWDSGGLGWLRVRRGGLGFGGPGIVGRGCGLRGLRVRRGAQRRYGGRPGGGRRSGRRGWLRCLGFGREAEGFADGGFDFFNGGDFGLALFRFGFGPRWQLFGEDLRAIMLKIHPVFALGGFEFGLVLHKGEAAFVEVGHPVALLQSLEADEFGSINVPEGFGADEADAEADHFIEVGVGGGVVEGGGEAHQLLEVVEEFLAEGAALFVVPLAETGEGAGGDCDVVGFQYVGEDVLLGTGPEAGDDLFLAISGEHAEWGIGAGLSFLTQGAFGGFGFGVFHTVVWFVFRWIRTGLRQKIKNRRRGRDYGRNSLQKQTKGTKKGNENCLCRASRGRFVVS
jgi:hypothetical protein